MSGLLFSKPLSREEIRKLNETPEQTPPWKLDVKKDGTPRVTYPKLVSECNTESSFNLVEKKSYNAKGYEIFIMRNLLLCWKFKLGTSLAIPTDDCTDNLF